MGAFRSLYPLPSKSPAAGGNAVIELSGLPDECRVAGFLLSFGCTTTAASGTPAVLNSDLVSLMATVDLDSPYLFVRSTGVGLWVLQYMMQGGLLNTSTASATGGVAKRANVWIPLIDPRCTSPNDACIPSKLIRDKSINVAFATSFAPTWDSVVVTCSAATLQATAFLIPDGGDVLPTKSRIAFEDWSQNTINLAGRGYFTDLYFSEEAMALTLAEHLQYTVSLDGNPVIDRIPTHQLADHWNRSCCRDAASALSFQAAASQRFIPILSATQGYKATQLPRGLNSVRIDIDSGSQTGGRICYRTLEPTSAGEERDAIIKMGHDPMTVQVEAKTAKASAVQGSPKRQERIKAVLPKRLSR